MRRAGILGGAVAVALAVACGSAQKRGSERPRAKVILQGSSLLIVNEGNLVPVEIQFALDSAVLEKDSERMLDLLVEFLGENGAFTLIEVQGHTDERGGPAYNMDLSKRRAEAVAQYLVNQGIPAERLVTRGFGDTRPAARGEGESAWQQNRRVEFVILEGAPEGG